MEEFHAAILSVIRKEIKDKENPILIKRPGYLNKIKEEKKKRKEKIIFKKEINKLKEKDHVPVLSENMNSEKILKKTATLGLVNLLNNYKNLSV